MPSKITLSCGHADTCLSDYWGGHHKAHLQVCVWRGMTPKQLRDALHSELNQGAVAGSDDRTRDDSGAVGDAWFKAAHAAINRDVRPAQKGARRLFLDLEKDEALSEMKESVYAFFVFSDKD